MKLVYVVYDDLAHPCNLGVKEKVLGQARAFRELGFSVTVVAREGIGTGIYVVKDGEAVQRWAPLPAAFRRLRGVLARVAHMRELLRFAKNAEPEAVYVRWTLADPSFVTLLRDLKKTGCVVALDVPTYPYRLEASDARGRIALQVDRLFNWLIPRFVDLVVSPSDRGRLFGIASLRVGNGVDLRRIPLAPAKRCGPVRMVGVSNLTFWQGYDRVLAGLRVYYSARRPVGAEVRFDVVGDGPERARLEMLVRRYNLTPYVRFHGARAALDLDQLYGQSCVGIGALARHRVGLPSAYPLKHREYCARGIPFVYAGSDPDFDEGFPYCLRLESSEEPIVIESVVDFFRRVTLDPRYPMKMREYAESRLSWEARLAPVAAEIMSRRRRVKLVPPDKIHVSRRVTGGIGVQ